VWGVGCGVWDVGCGVWGVGCGVWGVGCGVWGVGCVVWGMCSGSERGSYLIKAHRLVYHSTGGCLAAVVRRGCCKRLEGHAWKGLVFGSLGSSVSD